MKAKVLSAILTCVNILLVKGMDTKKLQQNGAIIPSSRILFGGLADVSDFPFLVTLMSGDYLCSGSIVASQWVMSAGHCISKRQCDCIKIFPAIWQFLNSINVEECYNHPKYLHDPFIHTYDISMLKIGENFLQYDGLKTIPLPAPGSYYPVGTRAIAAGWGRTEDGIYPNHLLCAEFQVEDWNKCNKKFQENNFLCQVDPNCIPSSIPKRVLCTQGGVVRHAGTCFGDSGGPVLIDGVVAGIVSFGLTEPTTGMCLRGSPSMHVNVADYLPWIYYFVDPTVDGSQIRVNPEFQACDHARRLDCIK